MLNFKNFFKPKNSDLYKSKELEESNQKNKVKGVDMDGIEFAVTSGQSRVDNIESKTDVYESDQPADFENPVSAEKISLVKNDIVNHQLTPNNIPGDLDSDASSELKKIDALSQQQLNQVKRDSLGSLQQVEKLIFTAGAVDATDIVRSRSYNTASEAMTADQEELKGFKGLIKKIWKYNYLEKVYHQTERIKAKDNILTSGNIFANEKLSDTEKESANQEARASILQRFTADIKDGLVEEDLGESREELGSESVLEKKIKTDLKKIINDYADGRINEAQFEEQKRRIFLELDEHKRQEYLANKDKDKKAKYEKVELYIDNFLEIAEKVRVIKNEIRRADDHQEKLAKFDFEINLVLGKAKEGVKTENHYNLVDKTIENLGRTRLGSLINETTLAVSVGLAASAISFISKRVLRSKLLAVGTLGASAVVAGAFMGAKENMMQKRERQTLERRSALSQDAEISAADQAKISEISVRIDNLETARQTAPDKKTLQSIDRELKKLNKERTELQGTAEFIYEKEKSSTLYQNLAEALYEINQAGEKKYRSLDTEADIDKLVNILADIEARLQISNSKKVDLISYDSLAKMETQRKDLLLLKCDARKRLKEISDQKRDYVRYLTQLCGVHAQELLEGSDGKLGINQRDKDFNKHKNGAVIKKTVFGALGGLAVGTVAQEAAAFFSDKQEGLVENLLSSHKSSGFQDTLLQNLFGQHADALHEVAVTNGAVKIPDYCELIKEANGSYSLQRGSEILANHLTLDGNGAFTPEAQNILAENGINLTSSSHLIESGQTIITESHSSPEEYLNKHPENVKEISRNLWYGNDTPMYVGEDGKLHGADLNELRAHWGGDHGNGINLKTNSYEMSAFKMTPDGSYQTINGEKLQEDAASLIKEGKMKFLFSLSSGTQNKVIEIPVDPATGKISVPRDSELGKLLFGEKNGQTFLKVKFAEVAAVSGVGQDGVEKVHVFATAVGEGLKDVDTSVVTEVPPITNTASVLGVPHDVAAPPVIPITSRTPLRRKREIVEPESYYTSYYGGPQKDDHSDLNRYSPVSNANILLASRNNTIKGTDLNQYNVVANNLQDHQNPETTDKRLGLKINLDREVPYDAASAKKHAIDLADYDSGSSNSELTGKYDKYAYITEELEILENYDSQADKVKAKIKRDCAAFNKRFKPDNPISLDDYIGQQITRVNGQINNILISNAELGEKPFNPEFYDQAPLVKGVERAEEIVIILDSPIGDAVLTIPALIAVQKYLAINKMNKPIKLVTTSIGMKLFKCVKDQFPQNVELINYNNIGETFANDTKEKFVINAHKEFKDYKSLHIEESDAKDLSRVMSVAWDSWRKEEIPKRPGLLEKYDPIPARIMRNFENMFGQKLFEDINGLDHFLDKDSDFDQNSLELKKKYNIADNNELIVISAGSSVMPKEYSPEKWKVVIEKILIEHPDAKVLFLDDPDKRRSDRYSPMVKDIINKNNRLALVNEAPNYLNTIMSMADVVITPDTGLGHYAGALGKPNIMLILGDPVRWSTAKTERIIHKKGRETYAKNKGTYEAAWQPGSGYYVNDNGNMIGASNFSPEVINQAVDKYLKK